MSNMSTLVRLKELGDSYEFVDLLHDEQGWLLLAGTPEQSCIVEGNTAVVDCINQAHEKHLKLKRGEE